MYDEVQNWTLIGQPQAIHDQKNKNNQLKVLCVKFGLIYDF